MNIKATSHFLFLTGVLNLLLVLCSGPAFAGTYDFSWQIRFPVHMEEIWDSGGEKGLPFAQVEVYDEETIGSEHLGTFQTDRNGYVNFSVTPIADALDPDADIYIVIKLYNDWVDVEQFGGGVYSWKSQTLKDLKAGTHEMTAVISGSADAENSANIFAVASWALDMSYNEESVSYVDRIPIVYPIDTGDAAAYCDAIFGYISISKGNDIVNTILHEVGHCIAMRSPVYDFPLIVDYNYGGDPYHSLTSEEYPEVAFVEGWAQYYADYISDLLVNPADPAHKMFDKTTDIVAGENTPFSPYKDGNETNVAGAFWDLTDSEADTQTIFVSATQTTPITDVKLWDKVTNLSEVNLVLAVSASWVAVYGKDKSAVEGIYIFTRSSKPQLARYYTNPDKWTPFQIISGQLDFLFSSNYLYIAFSTKLIRVNLKSTFPMLLPRVVVLNGSSATLLSYATTDNTYDASYAFSSDRKAIYVSIPDDGTTTYTSTTYKIADLDAAVPTMTRIGSAHPSSWNPYSCDWFYNDKCYAIQHPEDGLNNTLFEFDPVTGVTTDLWPSSNDGSTFHYGDFADVMGIEPLDFDSFYGKIIAFNDRAYFFLDSGCLIMKVDLTKQVLSRHAGDGTCALKNDANLASEFENNTRIVMDDSLYYYASVLDFTTALPALTAVRQVEWDPDRETVTEYCGTDTMDLEFKQVYNSLATSITSIKPYVTSVYSSFGGDYRGLLANNWIEMSTCESTSGSLETVPPGGTSSRTMDETQPQTDEAKEYFDGDDEMVTNPTTAAHKFGKDSDGDGIYDADDEFPSDSAEWVDFDRDGAGDNTDTDDDGDGVDDTSDAFPFDSSESSDTDSDGVGDNAGDT